MTAQDTIASLGLMVHHNPVIWRSAYLIAQANSGDSIRQKREQPRQTIALFLSTRHNRLASVRIVSQAGFQEELSQGLIILYGF